MAGPLPRVAQRRAVMTGVLMVVLLAFVATLAADRGGDDEPSESARAEPEPAGGAEEEPEDSQSEDPPVEVMDGEASAPPPTTWRSTGRFVLAAGRSEVAGAGPVRRYTVEVEEGSGGDVDGFAAEVDEILADPRGWTTPEGIGFQRVSDGDQADFTVRLSAPDTVDLLCAPLETEGDVSCAQNGMAVINTMRWHRGAEASGLGLADYRRYLISHEVGHLLDHSHAECPGPGQPAPVMMQQTLDIGECAPNPWPAPDADGHDEAAGG